MSTPLLSASPSNDPLATEEPDGEPSLRGIAIVGLIAIAACFGGFGGWSLLAPLNSAAIASGQVVVDSHRKTVQHLEGGILRALLAREGDHVRAGQPLALLDATQSDSQLGQITSQHLGVQARMARLNAEKQDRRTVEFPAALLDQVADPIAAEAIETQRRLFEARWRAYDSSVAIIRKRIEQFREQVAAAQVQLSAIDKRLTLTREDLTNAEYLLERGYEKRTRVRELQRAVEELQGQAAQQRGAVAQAQQSIAGAEMEIVNLGDSRQAEVAKDLEDARAQDADLGDRLRAARDVRNRRQIVSPQDGVVTDVRLVTPGGVIGPGQPLMDIVPVDDPLIIEARVSLNDIEVVHPGLPADVQITAFTLSTTPPIQGRVSYVSADMLTDPRTGDKYYLARVAPAPEARNAWAEMNLQPGMPADVMIITGERRAYAYFIDPLRQRLRHTFREN